MGGKRHHIDVVLHHIARNLAEHLDPIRVKNDAALVAKRADLADRLHHADLVVGPHDRDQDRLVGHGSLQRFQRDQPVGLNRQVGHPVAGLLHPLAGVEHRFVLRHLRDDVVAALAIHLGNALDREIV